MSFLGPSLYCLACSPGAATIAKLIKTTNNFFIVLYLFDFFRRVAIDDKEIKKRKESKRNGRNEHLYAGNAGEQRRLRRISVVAHSAFPLYGVRRIWRRIRFLTEPLHIKDREHRDVLPVFLPFCYRFGFKMHIICIYAGFKWQIERKYTKMN